MVIGKISNFFDEQKDFIKRKLREENHDLNIAFSELEKLLGKEIRNVMGSADIFDIRSFCLQFEELKGNQDNLRLFLQDYLSVQQAQGKNLLDTVPSAYFKYDWIVHPEFELDQSFVPYQLNVEKFKYHHRPIAGDMGTVLEKFCKTVVNILECKFMRARHITKEDYHMPGVSKESAYMTESVAHSEMRMAPRGIKTDVKAAGGSGVKTGHARTNSHISTATKRSKNNSIGNSKHNYRYGW
jgi:hypothetical protein